MINNLKKKQGVVVFSQTGHSEDQFNVMYYPFNSKRVVRLTSECQVEFYTELRRFAFLCKLIAH